MDWGAFIDPETFERDTKDGIHFTIKGYISFYKAMAAAYRSILTRKDTTVIGHDVTTTVT
jgi:lysophospholipase L1-like esterase